MRLAAWATLVVISWGNHVAANQFVRVFFPENNHIQRVELDRYIQGVLLGEVPTHWPFEALKAQAIAARSYVLHQATQRRNLHYDVRADHLDQVFKKGFSRRLQRAVRETSGQVVQVGAYPMKTYFHSDCGGITERPSSVWGGEDLSHASVKCPLKKAKRWRVPIPLRSLAKKLQLVEITGFKVVGHTSSGRVRRVAFWNKHDKVTLSGQQLRRLLGFNKLRSTMFDILPQKNHLQFVGRGFGHGSGLCQHGARHMAMKGYSAEEIILHYYPKAHLTVFDIANL